MRIFVREGTSEWKLTTPNRWSPRAACRVDARCDEFGLALATGKSPQIESFLSDISASERQDLLLELLGLELDFRVARGEQPKVGDYAKRFPEQSAAQLAAIVEASRGRDRCLQREIEDRSRHLGRIQS